MKFHRSNAAGHSPVRRRGSWARHRGGHGAPPRCSAAASIDCGRMPTMPRQAHRHRPRRGRQASRSASSPGTPPPTPRRSVQVAPTSSIVKGAVPSDAVSFPATVAANSVNGGFNAHATIDGLDSENTAYSYRVGVPRAAGPPTVRLQDAGLRAATSTSCSSATRRSARPATSAAGRRRLGGHPEGRPRREPEGRAAGLGRRPGRDRQHRDAVERVPRARQAAPVPVGRHHRQPRRRRQGLRAALWTPNTDRSAPFYNGDATWPPSRAVTTGSSTRTSLFIDLNSNALRPTAAERRRTSSYVTNVVKEHGAQGQVHGARLPPLDLLAGRPRQRRRQPSSAARTSRRRSRSLGVDLVLQGHDHSYSRSYEIKNGAEGEPGRAARCRRGGPGPGRRHLRDGELRVGLEVLRPHRPDARHRTRTTVPTR